MIILQWYLKLKETKGTGLKRLTCLILKLIDKLDLRRGVNSIVLSNLSIYYAWKNIKGSYNNNKFEISAPIWNLKF